MGFTEIRLTTPSFILGVVVSRMMLTTGLIGLAGPAAAQSREFMVNECSSAGQTYFRDFTARTEMQYNGQRVDGTHAINGRIYLETRLEDFACSHDRSGTRIVEFFAQGRTQASPLPGGGATAGGGSGIVRVTGLATNDVLNVRSGPGASGTELREQLAPGATRRYILSARARQFLYVRLASGDPRMSWRIQNPDSTLLDQASASREYRGQLWQTGSHVIEVINASTRSQAYSVIFGIN